MIIAGSCRSCCKICHNEQRTLCDNGFPW